MKTIKFDEYEAGAEIPELTMGPVKHMDLVRYAGASGDFNPIHTDPIFAKEAGLPGTIAHGMYIMAQVGRLCTNWVNPKQIKNLNVKFKDMTTLGQTITCSGKVKKKNEEEKTLTVAVEAKADDGKVKVAGDMVVVCD